MAANGETNGNGLAIKEEGPVLEKNEVDFEKVSIKEAFTILQSTHDGLTDEEAAKRLDEYGPNRLPETSIHPLVRFLGYLWNPLSWAMEVAALLAIILLDYADFALIVALLFLNATISFVEESNADKAIKALAGALAPKSKVLRSGKVITIDAANLVPGDVIIVRLGDIVPADIKLLGDEGDPDEQPMQIDQAALTGESLPAKKFTGATAFSGSTIKQGERHAVVYATGINTFFGRAAALISSTNNVANITKIMTRIGAMCLVTIGAWCLIELIVQFAVYNHSCSLGPEKCPTLTNLLVIIVGGIPIAMPTVLSVTLALGAFQLAKEGAIVARMSAVEEMAGMDILCSDKTGTLTLNKLSVDQGVIYPMSGYDINGLMKHAALSANIVTEEPIDVVLWDSYADHDSLPLSYKLTKFVPFNPSDKYTCAYVETIDGGEKIRIMKGAPQVVLKRAHNFEAIKGEVEGKIVDFANRGYRALGIGRAEGDGPLSPDTHWTFLGLVPLFDPPRHDTKETIERCIEKGISVKMVTGDQVIIGKETARQLGMGTNIHKVEHLLSAKGGGTTVDGHSDIGELVEKADGFGEVFPEHKYEIVAILQKRGHMVGMTGDGVNDAPALKKADVGIAVDGATDAARGAADIVLTKPGLSVIVSAVIGARKIFQRMTTYAKYTVAMTFRICFTFGLLTVIYNWYFPTILIVLLAVFNDGAMIALSKDRVTPSDLPNTWRLRNIFIVGIVYGLYLTLSTWVLFFVAAKSDFFADKVKMFSLEDTDPVLTTYCDAFIKAYFPGQTNVCQVGTYAEQNPVPCADVDIMAQCMTEQKYVRGAMLRSLIYAHVSISGQALVFVTRNLRHSLLDRAGGLTYIAFFLAQIAATLIAALGFGGYPEPPDKFEDCKFCELSTGGLPTFIGKGVVPIEGTEGVYTASVIGCTYYVVVAWIWAIIWHIGLDPIKWAMAYILNEDGTRDKAAQRVFVAHREKDPTKTGKEIIGPAGMAPAGFANPLGRASITHPPPKEMLQRMSVVKVEQGSDGLRRVSVNPMARASLQRASTGAPAI